MFKKSVLVLLVLILSLVLITGCGNSNTETGTDEGTSENPIVKVGFMAPLTGGEAAEGSAARNAFEMAFEELNASGELPYTVEVISMDDASKAETGASAAQKLVAEKGMIAMCGHWNSPVAEATIPIAEQANIPLVIWGAIRSSLTDGSHYPIVTRTCPTAEQENIPLADKVFGELGYKNIFIVSDVTSYGKANTMAITEQAGKYGVNILGTEEIQVGTTDFRPILAKIQGMECDAVYYGGVSQEAGLLKRQMYELSMNDILYFGISGISTSDFIVAAGEDAAEGSYSSTPAIDPSLTEIGSHYLESYEAHDFDVPLEVYTAYSYDAALAIINAMKSIDGVPTAAQMVDAIANVEFEGALGYTTFDENGQTTNIATYSYLVAQDGVWLNWDDSEYATGIRSLPKK